MDYIEALKKEIDRHPLSTPLDVIKFIYQGEFYGGHLIPDKDKSLKMIEDEINSCHYLAETLYVDLDNNTVRLNLINAYNMGMTADNINDIFIRSSNEHTGNIKSFENKINDILLNFDIFSFEFSKEDFISEYDDYLKEGIRPVSHSEIYRKNYNPCYRVINKRYIPIK